MRADGFTKCRYCHEMTSGPDHQCECSRGPLTTFEVPSIRADVELGAVMVGLHRDEILQLCERMRTTDLHWLHVQIGRFLGA